MRSLRRRRRARPRVYLASALTLIALASVAQGRPSRSIPPAGPPAGDLTHTVGQLIIGTYGGMTPPASMLAAVRAGRLGGVILMGDNTAGPVPAVRRAVDALQAAARRGQNPPLLVMTDQEGGQVKRLPGPPAASAAEMGAHPAGVRAEGRATARLLRDAGVDVDLAPVADVAAGHGFIAMQGRAFGTTAAGVARSACAFARGLLAGGVADTLKHFPGLGSAVSSTDDAPVAVSTGAARIEADAAAYRDCGSGPRSLVMISSASYPRLTGPLPAVISPRTYHRILPALGVDAVTISDAMGTPALSAVPHPALSAVRAGLDLLLYSGDEAQALSAQTSLVADVRHGRLKLAVVRQAAQRVLALKRALSSGGPQG